MEDVFSVGLHFFSNLSMAIGIQFCSVVDLKKVFLGLNIITRSNGERCFNRSKGNMWCGRAKKQMGNKILKSPNYNQDFLFL